MFFPHMRHSWIAACIGIAFAIIVLWPLPASVRTSNFNSVHIVDRNGRSLYEVRSREHGSNKVLTLDDIAPSFINAIIAVEDRDFYRHNGISAKGIVRAMMQNIAAARVVAGGSTITEQLIRSRLQPLHRTLLYKIKEAFFAWKLEIIRTKRDILTDYVNTAYFGEQAYGIDAAAHTYFGTSAHELSIAQSALLAGLVQSPSVLDPFLNKKGAMHRQKIVLDAMRNTGVIHDEELRTALHEPLTLTTQKIDIRAPHFVEWLTATRPDVIKPGTTVQTTLDVDLQSAIERIIERKLDLLKDLNVTSAAVVVLDAKQGDLLAMVGSADYFDRNHDGAVNVAVSPRQPGSALKPFTYALALSKGDTAATTVADVETQFFTQEGNPYIPRNYDYGYHGLVRYREALANSYNIAAVKVLERVGVGNLLALLQGAGITTLNETPDHYGLALTLGSGEVTLLELTKAYAMFARGGETLHLRTLINDPVENGTRILDTTIAWLISDILSDATARLPEFGMDTPLTLDRPVAVKTGTTRNSRDNWTIGYTPSYVVGVWVGNADNAPMRGTSGVTGAGPIFHDVMETLTAGTPTEEFSRPNAFTRVTICRLSGLLPTPACPHTMEEWFVRGTEPTTFDDFYQSIAIDTRNGLHASTSCPTNVVIQETFTVFPPELTAWARENGYKVPPKDASPLCPGSSDEERASWLRITSPNERDSFLLDPLIPDSDEKILLEAEASPNIRTMEWYVDGALVGTGKTPNFRIMWPPHIGTFTIEARANGLRETRHIDVIR